MLGDFLKSVAQLREKTSISLLKKSLLIVILVYTFLCAAVFIAIYKTSIPEIVPFANTIIDAMSVLATPLLAAFLFPPVLVAVSGLFLEEIVDAVEKKYYPSLPPATPVPLLRASLDSLVLLLVSLALNLLLLPFVFFPVAGQLAYLALNGYLISREYFELVASRRTERKNMRWIHRKNLGKIWLRGAAVTALLTIPLVNLLVPVIAAALFTHLSSRIVPPALRREDSSPDEAAAS